MGTGMYLAAHRDAPPHTPQLRAVRFRPLAESDGALSLLKIFAGMTLRRIGYNSRLVATRLGRSPSPRSRKLAG